VPFATVNGQRLHYTDTGSNAPALVFSHGLLMDGEMFEPQVAHFEQRYRCITWDERGHGQSAEATAPFTFWDLADDLAALCEHLEISQAGFVGMSQGGFLQLRLGIRRPELVRSLTCIDTQAGPEDPDKLAQYRSMMEVVLEEGRINDFIAETVYAILVGADFPTRQAWIDKIRGRDPRLMVEPLNAVGNREDLTPRLHEITAPAIVIHGSEDAAIELELAERLCRGLPGCSHLEVIPGAGHASNLTHPGPVNAAMDAFLERHS
jgi:pimeloyl-ACP methyl ester carboxylesterase